MPDMDISELQQVYVALLQQPGFIPEELNYSVFEKHKPVLQNLAMFSKSGISVFDCYQMKHIFYSPNFCSVLGYDVDDFVSKEHDYLDSRIHPDDYYVLTQNGISLLKLFYELPPKERMNYKLVSEYRMLNSKDKYVQVIEQHQALELDKSGNIWLAMSLVDISPNQELHEGVKSQVYNFITGAVLPIDDEKSKPTVELTKREKEILQLVKDGFLSKEISDKLSISLHTVNTHRQKILEKLGANNSIEAIALASKLGLIEKTY